MRINSLHWRLAKPSGFATWLKLRKQGVIRQIYPHHHTRLVGDVLLQRSKVMQVFFVGNLFSPFSRIQPFILGRNATYILEGKDFERKTIFAMQLKQKRWEVIMAWIGYSWKTEKRQRQIPAILLEWWQVDLQIREMKEEGSGWGESLGSRMTLQYLHLGTNKLKGCFPRLRHSSNKSYIQTQLDRHIDLASI